MRVFVVLPSMLCLAVQPLCIAQNSSAAERDDQDIYDIYSLVLPSEQSYRFAKGALVIRQETLAEVKLDDSCLAPEAAREFKDAIEDYKRQTKTVLLQRRFTIDKPYELVDSETIGTLIKDHNWDEFYKRYPDSGGILMISAVGFNQRRTLAIVYTWSACRDLCGSGSFVLLKKINGKWKPASGVRCSVAS
jgi:hypothetical protein